MVRHSGASWKHTSSLTQAEEHFRPQGNKVGMATCWEMEHIQMPKGKKKPRKLHGIETKIVLLDVYSGIGVIEIRGFSSTLKEVCCFYRFSILIFQDGMKIK